MQRTLIAAIALVLSSASALAQKDAFQGRWEGTVRSRAGETPATVVIRKDGNNYSGTISSMQDKSEFPFNEIKLEGDKLRAKLQSQTANGPVSIDLRFEAKGQALRGKGELRIGNQSIDLDYNLKRTGDPEAPVTAAAPAKPQIGQASSKAELDEFSKARDEPDVKNKKTLVEEFMKKYPESGLKAYAHQEMAVVGQQTNNFELMTEHGEKSLELLPDNYLLMTQLAQAYAERNLGDKAEQKAENAIDLIQNAQKPPQATEDQWTQGKKMLLNTNFSALGYVQLRRSQEITDAAQKKAAIERSIAPFKKALEYNAADDISYWRLGTAYAMLNDYPNAESNLAKAVAINGIAVTYARSSLEDIYKRAHNNSLDGIDKIIAKAKSELSLP